jgi:hypothetical protein
MAWCLSMKMQSVMRSTDWVWGSLWCSDRVTDDGQSYVPWFMLGSQRELMCQVVRWYGSSSHPCDVAPSRREIVKLFGGATGIKGVKWHKVVHLLGEQSSVQIDAGEFGEVIKELEREPRL